MENIKELTNTELASFFSQMAMILKSGISSIEGVEIMLEDSKNEEEVKLLNSIKQPLTDTGLLSEALKTTNAFPPYAIDMISIGERTGKVDDVMNNLAKYYDMEDNISKSIKASLTYPFIMILLMFIVLLLLITKVLPIFNQVFNQLGASMTGLPLLILNIGEFLNNHLVVSILILFIPLIILFYFMKTNSGRDALVTIANKVGKENSLHQKLCAQRFASAMALTISAGLSVEEGIDLSKDLIDDPEFNKKLNQLSEDVHSGIDFSTSISKNHIFSTLYTRMITVANRTGESENAMHTIAEKYNEEINDRLSQIVSSIEPTLVIILSILVGIILLAVMLPLINLLSLI